MLHQRYSNHYSELWLEAHMLRGRCVLLAYGMNATEKKSLIDFMLPSHENTRDWGLFLLHLTRGGLSQQHVKKIVSSSKQHLSQPLTEFFPNCLYEWRPFPLLNRFKTWIHVYLSLKNPKKLRLLLAWPFAIAWIISCKVTLASLVIGTLFILPGEMLRLWASGTIIKSSHLTQTGPYRYTRNPLYLGSAAIGLGFVILGQSYPLIILFPCLFWYIYGSVMVQEEAILEERFGPEFLVFKKEVPRFFPKFKRDISGKAWPFSWKRILQHGEWEAVLLIIVVMTFALFKLRYLSFILRAHFGPK